MKLSMDQQDFELYLLLYVQEKSHCICLNLETEAKNHDYCLCFLYFGYGYLFSEEAIRLGQLLISTQGSLAHSSVVLLQLSTQLYHPYLWYMSRNFSPGQRSARLLWFFGSRINGAILFPDTSAKLKPKRMQN